MSFNKRLVIFVTYSFFIMGVDAFTEIEILTSYFLFACIIILGVNGVVTDYQLDQQAKQLKEYNKMHTELLEEIILFAQETLETQQPSKQNNSLN